MVVAYRYLVSGRVQGVGFRFFTEDAAAREGLSGQARNLPDGRVEISVEGEAEAVARFERSIWQGPPGARVDDVLTETQPATGRVTGFRIRG
ncbi:MAG: acylphosphatase [Luteitalea sp.]|nr:acylphosphatase [Luteitalea sp.]